MSRQKVVTLLLVIGLMLVVGCSTSGSIRMHDSVGDKTIKGSTVSLIVFPNVSESNGNENDIAIKLRGQIAAQLLGAGLFKNIAGDGDQGIDHKITVKITEIREVSGVARVMWGAMAGNNKVAGEVTVINIKTGDDIRSFSYIGESAAHPFSGKSDIRDAIDRAAEEIVKGLSI